MRKLGFYRIFNTIEDKWIFDSNSESEYIKRVKLIAKENEQNPKLETYKDCDKYILDECSQNLSLD